MKFKYPKETLSLIFSGKQRGSSIIVVLIVLALMSLLGVAAAKISMSSSQSTRYQRDYRVAYEAAQAGVIDAIMDIEGGSRKNLFFIGNEDQFLTGCTGSGNQKGLCLPSPDGEGSFIPASYKVDFSATSHVASYGDFTGRSFVNGTTGLKPALPPRYIIELLEDHAEASINPAGAGSKPRLPIYRITAMGFGPTKAVHVVLQADYRKAN